MSKSRGIGIEFHAGRGQLVLEVIFLKSFPSMPLTAPESALAETERYPSRDGRQQRSQESRRKIVQAMLELVKSGVMEPSAEMVADQAGVGLRSVFRHFKDMESLRSEMNDVVSAQILSLIKTPLAGRTWEERLGELLERRATVFERMMPFRRAGNLQTHRSPILQAANDRLNAFLREALQGLLPESLVADIALFQSLDLILCFESWIRLRHDQGLTAEEARQVVRRAVSTLIARPLGG